MRALGWLACPFVLAQIATAATFMNPATCADDVVASIADIADAANFAAQAAVDCTIPDLDEASCAIDISNFLSTLAGAAEDTTACTLSCGNLDNSCAKNVIDIVKQMGSVAANLIAAAGDCTVDTFLCAYDVMTSVATFNDGVTAMLAALQLCQDDIQPGAHPLRRLMGDSLEKVTAVQATLREVVAKQQEAQQLPAEARSTVAVPQNRVLPAGVGAILVEKYAELERQLQQSRAAEAQVVAFV